MQTTRQVQLARRPIGHASCDDFTFATIDLPDLGEGDVLLKILYLSLDPYMRGRMDAAESYAEPVQINEVMVGATVAEVVDSRHADFLNGDVVLSNSGWQTHAVECGNTLRKISWPGVSASLALGAAGMPGLTAYTGLLTIGRPKPGETVVVAAASGAVGSIVGQIARLHGARAVGIAGGADKCAFVKETLGFDAAVDHKAADFDQQLAAACPNGIDVYFENVGGHVWDVVAQQLNQFARIPVCGLIAGYDGLVDGARDRLPGFMYRVLIKSMQVRGFIVTEFFDQQEKFEEDMLRWLASGEIKYREDVVAGLDNAPQAFLGLLQGQNFGKLIIDVARGH